MTSTSTAGYHFCLADSCKNLAGRASEWLSAQNFRVHTLLLAFSSESRSPLNVYVCPRVDLNAPLSSSSRQASSSACSTGSRSSMTACSTTWAAVGRRPSSRWSSWTARWAARASALGRSAPEHTHTRQTTSGARTASWISSPPPPSHPFCRARPFSVF